MCVCFVLLSSYDPWPEDFWLFDNILFKIRRYKANLKVGSGLRKNHFQEKREEETKSD